MVILFTIVGFWWVMLWTPYPDAERNTNSWFIGENIPAVLRAVIAFGGLFVIIVVGGAIADS